MNIRDVRPGDLDEWLRMRCLLWPEVDRGDLRAEVAAYGAATAERQLQPGHAVNAAGTASVVLVCEREAGGLCGFAEVGTRDVAEGAVTSPVGFLEAWYVDDDCRRRRIGRELVARAEAWARALGCQEMASDTDLDNLHSQQLHRALGFSETARLVSYLKKL